MNGNRYGDINHNELDSDTLFMDGCSMPHHNFVGAIMVAAPPQREHGGPSEGNSSQEQNVAYATLVRKGVSYRW